MDPVEDATTGWANGSPWHRGQARATERLAPSLRPGPRRGADVVFARDQRVPKMDAMIFSAIARFRARSRGQILPGRDLASAVCAACCAVVAATSACSSSTPASSTPPAHDSAQELWGDMKPVVSVKELMRDMIDPASDF